MIYTSESLNDRIAIDISMAHRSSVADGQACQQLFDSVTFELLWSDCCTFFQLKLVFAVSTCLRSRQLMLSSLWRRSCRRPSVHSDENRKSSQSHWFGGVQATVGVKGIRPALAGALEKYSDIATVDADDGKHTSIAGWRLDRAAGVGTHLSNYWQKSTDTFIGRALLAKF